MIQHSELKLYNTLGRHKEAFRAIQPPQLGLYCCGPTVYDFAHIGNMRTYIFEDLLRRVLEYNGYWIKHVMNITDVGHLTGGQHRRCRSGRRQHGAKRPTSKEVRPGAR